MAEHNETPNTLRGLTFGGGYHEVNAKYIQTNPRNSCPELILPNGKCRRKSGIEDRQTCQFNCNVGYAPVGPEPVCSCFIKIHSIISLPRSKCIWNNVPEKDYCEPIEPISSSRWIRDTRCARLPKIDNHDWICSNKDFDEGTICFASCKEGSSSSYRDIQKTKQICKCVEFGENNHICKWHQGSKNYRGPDANIIKSNRGWKDILVPKCKSHKEIPREGCPTLPRLAHGNRVCSSSNLFKSKCDVICNPGYTKYSENGRQKTLRCGRKRGKYSWTQSIPDTCIPIPSFNLIATNDTETNHYSCENKQDAAIGHYDCSMSNEVSFGYENEICTLICPDEYHLKRHGIDQKICQCGKTGCKWRFSKHLKCIPNENIALSRSNLSNESEKSSLWTKILSKSSFLG